MSKYGNLRKGEGHSKFFLTRTLAEHDDTMDHPLMKKIYDKTITDLELQEALFVPLMERFSTFQPRHFHCFVRHPSMRSQNFPEHLKHTSTISVIKRKKEDLRELLHKIGGTGVHVSPK